MIDTYAVFKRMQAAGMDERLAEAVVDVAMQAYAVRGAVQLARLACRGRRSCRAGVSPG